MKVKVVQQQNGLHSKPMGSRLTALGKSDGIKGPNNASNVDKTGIDDVLAAHLPTFYPYPNRSFVSGTGPGAEIQ